MDYDVIIIGAGVSGLVAGNYLADKGRRVLIVEQAKGPGGCAASFTRGGYTFDAAVHWISQAGEGGIVRQILGEFGLSDTVRFNRLPGPARIKIAGKDIAPGFGRGPLVEEFSRAFPSERDLLARFWDEVAATKAQLWRLVKSDPGGMRGIRKLLFNATFPLKFRRIAKYHKRPASEVLERYFKDEDLRRALGALGIFPDISFVHYAWFNSVTLDADAYYPEGGIHAVPDALAKRFTEKGGEIRFGALAEKVLIMDRAAAGIRLSGGEEISADTVLCAGDARNLYLDMVGEEYLPASFVAGLKEWRPSESFFYVYLGVDMDLKAKGFDGTPLWYFPDGPDRENFPMLGGEALGIGMPSLLEPSLAPPGKGIVILGMIANCAFMDTCPVRKQGEGGKGAYRMVKERIGEHLIDLAAGAIPGLRESIDLKIVASPHTFERYTMNWLGASSGWSMAANRQHKLPIQSPIRNLYLAGHWTMNPGGVPAAFVSGKMVAENIL